jgi:transposase-like protein
VDETKLGKEQLFIWAARDVDSKEVLAFRCSFTRSSLDAELLLKYALQYCENKPLILVDRAPWYKDALKRLELEYEYQTFGERNRIERWFRNTQSQAQNILQPFSSQWNHKSQVS